MRHRVLRQMIRVAALQCAVLTFATADEVAFSGRSLADYLDQALAANPRLLAADQRWEAARLRVPQAAAWADPRLQVTRFVESPQTRTGPQMEAAMLTQAVPWFGKLHHREQAAVATASAEEHGYEDRRLKLAEQVAQSYYEYGFTGEAARLTAENLALLRSLEPIVEEKVRSGGDLNALLRVKVEIGRVEDRLQSLGQRRQAQSALLRDLLAVPGGPDPILWPDWRAPTAMEAAVDSAQIGGILAIHPELRKLDSMVESARARTEVARLRAYPDFVLGLSYTRVSTPVVNPTTPGAGEDPWGVVVSLNVPLWFGVNRAEAAEARANRSAAEQDRVASRNALEAKLQASLATLADARRRLELYGDELLGLAEQALANSRASYEGGRTGILEVIDSERSLLDLQLLYWRAAADAWQRRVTIELLANQPLLGTYQLTEPK